MSDLSTAYRALGFASSPFSITPDTAFFFPGAQHVAALRHLSFGVTSGGITVLTGEVGLGKTLLCRQVLREAPEDTRIAYVLDPLQSYQGMLVSLIREFTGEDPHEDEPGGLLRELQGVVLELARDGVRAVILVDEAHRLTPELLEGLRMLTNLETEKSRLVSLVLVGQPELERTLALRSMRPLAQRVSVRCRLTPFSASQTAHYVRHRLRLANSSNALEFTGLALRAVHHASRGAPRRINQICDRAVLLAFAESRLYVNTWMALRAAREVKGSWL
ncbi:ExeA family protein [Quisquiliibacterium transsilvanicum]|uniref:General secretion pathway protein A n=1 Tax=Quisquiliibacterium transsilvanicum TaxID=1549638 RepID=A0A7W8HHC7_9BURK|nr:AAA family ATPase [Quisquiliibacterium transsilvanicum]MBB5272064.1 general secretion pathway protein A [Quisquiliibacterium transsilvanicum]